MQPEPRRARLSARSDVAVIGAGIIGLATALALTESRPNLRVTLFEKEADVAAHQSGHNSGVIHSGVYYRPGSSKADLAVRGHRSMMSFCSEHGVAVEACGKLIVATTLAEQARLLDLAERAAANGVAARLISSGELRETEPSVSGLGALSVPGTAIVDYREVCRCMVGILEARGVEVCMLHHCLKIDEDSSGVVIGTTKGDFRSTLVVNCAGLWSDRVARMHDPGRAECVIAPFRGEYYDVAAARAGLVERLIYPVPDPAYPFLGVHLTRSIHGGLHAGPNAIMALARAGYSWTRVDVPETARLLAYPGFRRLARRHWKEGAREVYRSFSKAAFGNALRRLVPAITDDDLVRGSAGVRAQALDRDGNLVDDFVLKIGPRAIDVLNAPSPAATASLEIGRNIAGMALGLVGTP